MKRDNGNWFLVFMSLALTILILFGGTDMAQARPLTGPYDVPDYFETPNFAYSPQLTKFADTLAPLCPTKNNLGQCIPVAVPDTSTYPGSDYYEIELVEYRERMHSDFPAVDDAGKIVVGSGGLATSGGTLLRGYRQTNTADPDLLTPHYLGPIIIAQKYDANYAPDAVLPGGGTNGRPVRIKFTNKLPLLAGGDLFVPVDTSIMGSGDFDINFDPVTKAPITPISGMFTQNRMLIHLHGGRTPWISDGTPHQWSVPVDDPDTPVDAEAAKYPKGVSAKNVPDMWFDATTHAEIPECAGKLSCATSGATNNPGPGVLTYYYTNQQSARLLFYHDHAWGTTRLGVYVGGAAGYLIEDRVETALVSGGTINGRTYSTATIPATQVPLIIQDKTFVDADTIAGLPGTDPLWDTGSDPTWRWGSSPIADPGAHSPGSVTATPVTGDLWWPHVYMPAQNPFNPDGSGVAPFGRWHYGPWFFPSTPVCGSTPNAIPPLCITYGPIDNPYYVSVEATPNQAPLIPGIEGSDADPHVSWGAEAFLDTMMVNGTVFPKLEVSSNPAGASKVRFRILNAAHDRFLNLQLYRAVPILQSITVTDGGSGYDVNELPYVLITGGGTNAKGGTATATVENGVITAIAVGIGGSNYADPIVTITDNGPGTGATATAILLGGAVDSITIDTGGSGYADPIVTITDNGPGADATATATASDGVVTAITLDTVGSNYIADTVVVTVDPPPVAGVTATATATRYTQLTEVGMVPAAPGPGIPATWPKDGREGGVPDPATRGPAIIQIGNDGGFLPTPVVLPNRPVAWNLDPTVFNVGNVLDQAQGGGTLFLGPAERADVIVDFSKFAGQTLILYNDAPTAFPAQDPHYDFYTGSPPRPDMGGYPLSVLPGKGPNIRTVMQINVLDDGGTSTVPVNDYPTGTFTALVDAFKTTVDGPGAFASSQDEIVAGQTVYDTAYKTPAQIISTPFPSTWPYWGVSRISDGAISFQRVDGTYVKDFLMKPKAIHDEMGATYDQYGRMSAKLGLERPFTNAAIANFILQNYVDPATEIVHPNEVQIWRITHNGVDSHPIHFHLFDVQVLNRVAWDGFIRPPDPGERGWKDTVKMNPLEDTIVAFRPVKPQVPFPLPTSIRPLNPRYPVNTNVTEGFSQIDITDGGALNPKQTNVMANYGNEYVWHCHILSHEENDMMRPIIFSDSIIYVADAGGGLQKVELGGLTSISSAVPAMMVTSGATMYATVSGAGIYQWNNSVWTNINGSLPDDMWASGSLLYATFGGGGTGLWKWDGLVWTKINESIPAKVVVSDSALYATGVGPGLWKYNGSAWTNINGSLPDDMWASGSVLYATFGGGGYGLWKWDGSTWTKINGSIPTTVWVSRTGLYATFDGGGYGLWKWDGSAWTKLNGSVPTTVVVSGSILYATFGGGGTGIWTWDGSAWTRINGSLPDDMWASGSILYATFGGGGTGIWKWDTGVWTKLTATIPDIVAAGF